MSTIKDESGSLNLRSKKYTGLGVELRKYSVQDVERLLGARLDLYGGDEAEFSFRLDQVKALAGKVASSPFTRYDAEVIYKEMLISSSGYCLPIQFTTKKCDKIQQPGYNSILPKLGFNRHFPRAVIFGRLKFQGKKLDDYKMLQYTSQLVRFVGYLRQKDELSNLLRIQMDQHQLIIGSATHFLELLSTTYPYG